MASEDPFVGGDFNCHLNPFLDKFPPGINPPSKQARVLNSICNDIGYSDVWRELHPTDSEFTFFSAPHESHTRIDYLFIPCSKMFLVLSCTIDRSCMSLVINLVDILPILLKKRADSQIIVSITDANNVRSFDAKTINKEFALLYSNLYKSEQPDNALAL
ncbi:hypothetical protein F7725_019080, partial [Dissostichus mawsoni]